MTAREIGFPCSAWEVRAILDGRKTQARRPIRNMPPMPAANCHPNHKQRHAAPYFDAYCSERRTTENPRGMSDRWCWWQVDDRQCLTTTRCPFGKPGDRLYVKETWSGYDGIEYRADEEGLEDDEDLSCHKVKVPDDIDVYISDYRHGWHSSTSMPRWASRITLEVVDVRVQRLQEISEEDAIAEGMVPYAIYGGSVASWKVSETATKAHGSARDALCELWDSTNAKRAPWDSNPFVWAISFRRVV